ncbi:MULTISPECIES: hypothetical protein [unclassified Fusibacter]|uniref:hypothetical protein n=1 Tax=unclassified Fusibacter TaxID=2624464 RepID=UPI0013E99E20|nr:MULTISPECIES: hypothetical protein [unclassified Fusibacter]MCK8058457.1 hypothetical protein [Fusibacter sp. A2]NPE22775.1 hypothetical protein [Fusibacter sp. A1]
MTKFQEKHISDKTLEEYETLHTNFIGNQHEEDGTLDKEFHEFLLHESVKEE